MTRKEALQKAIVYLRELKDDSLEDVLAELELMIKLLPITEWDLATTLDAVEQFYIENGRYPIAREFNGVMLPNHTTIKYRYGVSVEEFLETYYLKGEKLIYLNKSYKYRHKPLDYWLEQYKEFMLANPNVMNYNYDKFRLDDMPCLVTLKKIVGVKTWNELKKKAGLPVERSKKYPVVVLNIEEYEVKQKFANTSLKELEELLQKFQY